jgi:hypothetical protein
MIIGSSLNLSSDFRPTFKVELPPSSNILTRSCQFAPLIPNPLSGGGLSSSRRRRSTLRARPTSHLHGTAIWFRGTPSLLIDQSHGKVTRFRGTPSLSIDQNHGKATRFRGTPSLSIDQSHGKVTRFTVKPDVVLASELTTNICVFS